MTDAFPSITIYFKMGVVGMADEVNESFEINFDPNLSPEENAELLQMKAAIFAARLQLSYTELMTIKFLPFLEAKAKEEGWDLDSLL